MGNRAGLLLLLALVSGSLAAFLAFTFIRSPASGFCTTSRSPVSVISGAAARAAVRRRRAVVVFPLPAGRRFAEASAFVSLGTDRV